MMYYLNSNTNQIYSALTNNAITSFATTIEKLQSKTFSFMSENFIFLTKGLVMEDLRRWKTDDVFFPVSLEIDFGDANNIPAYLVLMEESGAVLQPEIANLVEAPDNTVAAFVCDEIPISYLSAIIFESEENQLRFRKPSTDLWFPEKLYKVVSEDLATAEPSLSVEVVSGLSSAVDTFLSEEDKSECASVVNKRNRYKAIAYFALRETANWQMDNLKTNVDLYIIDFLDGHKGMEGLLYKAFTQHLEELHRIDQNIAAVDSINETDTLLLSAEKDNVDKILIQKVLKRLYTFDKDKITLDRGCIETIKEVVTNGIEEPNVTALFDVIKDFLTSTYMNPKKALAKLNGHPAFKALMKFLDSSDNDAFMNRGCEGLTQYERRYAYMMFAALKGMSFVEREWKSNVNLEHRLEELATGRFHHAKMISSVPTSNTLAFCSESEYLYGIKFICSYWMGKQATLDVLLKDKTEDKIMAVYNLVAKDKNIKLDKLECFETPCVITITVGDFCKELQAINIDELKRIVKDTKLAKEISKKAKSRVDLVAFVKKYVLNDTWYSSVFEKYCVEIQRICRS